MIGVKDMKHRNIKSKMKKLRPLQTHPVVSRHVPETVWYSAENVEEMLLLYGSIYVKPDMGRQGNGIVRVTKINEIDCNISDNESSWNVPLSDVVKELEAVMSQRVYLIQERIDLATYRGCPFDIRMVMQRPHTTWQLTLTSAKIALREDAVVTNVSKGAEDYPLNDVLRRYDQSQDPMSTLKELVDLSHQISSILGSKYPFRIIGLDMAVDKEGKVWFIEANARPQCARCKLVNDETSQEKYEAAKKMIREGKKKLTKRR